MVRRPFGGKEPSRHAPNGWIDIHTHILPGLDDGAVSLEHALAMARVAQASGTTTVAATPHIREDYPFKLELIAVRVAELTDALAEHGVQLDVMSGGEVALSVIDDLDDEALDAVCLGEGRYVLIESPYSRATRLLESSLFDLQVRGFRPVLAHPERSPSFLTEPERLETLVSRGILCSVTAGSVQGQFGRRIRRFARMLLESGLAHNVSSDGHDRHRRPPVLSIAMDIVGRRSSAEIAAWLARDVPAAVMSGRDIPPRPRATQRRGERRRLFQRERPEESPKG